jgi:hypothetical protein
MDGVFAPALHEVCVVTVEIAAQLGLDLERWNIGLSGYKMIMVYLREGVCQLESAGWQDKS